VSNILLVDDHRENLVALEAILEPLGNELVSVTSGEAALRELLRREFALILLDVQMPGLDGFETAALIKQRERTRSVPIIFVTAISTQDAHVFRGYSAGAVDYIFKPFNPDVMRSKVEAFVELHRRTKDLQRQEEELRERELTALRTAERHRYRELAEAMPQIVWVADPEGHATYYNKRWFEYTGLAPNTTSDADWRNVTHPDDLAEATARREASFETGAVFEAEYRFRAADGGYRWHLGRAVPVRDEHGKIDHWVGTATDIDDQKRSEEVQRFLLEASTLLANTLSYRTTLASLARLAVPHLGDWCAIELVDADGALREVEVAHHDEKKVALARELRSRYPALGEGSGPAEVARTGQAELVSDISPEMIERVAVDDLHLELLRDLGLRSYMCVPMVARGRVRGTMTFVQAESGRVYDEVDLALAQDLGRRAAVAIDNAELFRQAEERAEAARVLAAIADGVVLVDQAGVVRLWNPAAERMTGLLEQDVVDKPLARVVPGLAGVEGGIADGRSATVPMDLAGREVWLSISAVRFDDGTVYAFRDLTDERALEAMRQDLVATVSHELRTPLAAIYGAAMTLQRSDVELEGDLRARLLQIVVEESDRLGNIVNDLLLASQLDRGNLHVSIQACDAVTLAEGVLEAARAHVSDGVELSLSKPAKVPKVAADPGQLQQVLANLVDNAVKYSPGGGRVTVTLEQRADQLRFSVSDPGLGIPAAEQRRIFEKFYRLDPDMNHGIGGTGLGLYICRELVRRVGGRIWVESQEGKGSTFFVELPLAHDRAPKKNKTASRARAA
jgi:PAS domain S-box-containing protein